jgi:hypothetical protein
VGALELCNTDVYHIWNCLKAAKSIEGLVQGQLFRSCSLVLELRRGVLNEHWDQVEAILESASVYLSDGSIDEVTEDMPTPDASKAATVNPASVMCVEMAWQFFSLEAQAEVALITDHFLSVRIIFNHLLVICENEAVY